MRVVRYKQNKKGRLLPALIGAGNGIFARGDLCRQTVLRTVWSFGQIAMQFSPYFKSRFTAKKQPEMNSSCFLELEMGFEPTAYWLRINCATTAPFQQPTQIFYHFYVYLSIDLWRLISIFLKYKGRKGSNQSDVHRHLNLANIRLKLSNTRTERDRSKTLPSSLKVKGMLLNKAPPK